MVQIKKVIEENYSIKIDKIYLDKKGEKYFFINDRKIYIKEINEEILKVVNNLVELSNTMYNEKKPTETFLLSKNGKYVIDYKNKKMALLMVNDAENIELDYLNIINNMIKVDKNEIRKYNGYNEWEEKVDMLENKIIEYNKEYSMIMKYVNYYIGLAENAIQLIKETDFGDNKYLGHLLPENIYEYKNYANPLLYVETMKTFDIASYFRYCFYNDKINYDELEKMKLLLDNENDKKQFLAIIMYPREIIENIENILNEKEEEKKVNEYFLKTDRFEKFIAYVQYNIINANYIKWLEDN